MMYNRPSYSAKVTMTKKCSNERLLQVTNERRPRNDQNVSSLNSSYENRGKKKINIKSSGNH